MKYRGAWCLLCAFFACCFAAASAASATSALFVEEILGRDPPPARVLWLTEPVQAFAREILGHPYEGLRLRYWSAGSRSVWILQEVGKELPITVGIAVRDRVVEEVRILAFRESRGGEVRYPFFTRQFRGSAIEGVELDRSIDGITGATLSVRAVTRLVRLALKLDEISRMDATVPIAAHEGTQ